MTLPYSKPGGTPRQEAAYRREMRRRVGSLSTASLLTLLIGDARSVLARTRTSPEVTVYFVLQIRMIRNELKRRGQVRDMRLEITRWLTLTPSRKV